MRNLTVLRKNAMPGAKKAVEVYIEDRENSEIEIEDVPCRKLGTVQSGEQKTFSVPETKAAVYVLDLFPEVALTGDKTTIPQGDTALYLVGKCRIGPDAPFRFSGPATADAPKYKPMSAKKGLIVAIAFAAAFLAPLLLKLMPSSGSQLDTTLQEPIKTYEEAGVSIDLPQNFQKTELDGYELIYSTMDAAAYFKKEPKKDNPEIAGWNLKEYTVHAAADKRVDPDQILSNAGIPYFTYEIPGADRTVYLHYSFNYETEDAFWNLDLAIAGKNRESYEPALMQWAKSVKFS